ncbi:AAA family ATPase [Bacillus sp. JJ1566]|uniref:AAA family ATPase n=1 Tax=Bacillus sp. JJ1566 TaxID=3122961 RepID=UPI002FFE3F95
MIKLLSIFENEETKSMLDAVAKKVERKIDWVKKEELFEKLIPTDPALVLLSQSTSYDMYNLCSKITKEYQAAKVLLVLQDETELDSKQAIRAGATDVIFLSSSPSKIRADIQNAILESKNQVIYQMGQPKKNGKVITVGSTKGGVGKTSISVNLAASYGKRLMKVAILDLDLQFGDVSMFYDVKPKRTIYDWAKEDRTGSQIENFMTPFKNGISILAAPQRPEFAEVITGEDVKRAIKALKETYDIVVVDTAPHLDENSIVAFENSDEILLITHQDLPTLKNTKLLIDTLETLKLLEKVKMILNRQAKVKGLTIETVEKIIGQKIAFTLPAMEKIMVTSVNEGKPLVYSYPRSQVAKKIFQMADTIVVPAKTSGRKKLKSKRVVHAGGYV